MVARWSALRAGHPLPHGRFLVFTSVRSSVDSSAMMLLEVLSSLKIKFNDLVLNPTCKLPASIADKFTITSF
jgi:hypothetical protein